MSRHDLELTYHVLNYDVPNGSTVSSMVVRAVFLDVGETLVDETRVWASWADWLGVPRFTFFAAIGGLIERDEPHWKVFDLFRPGIDWRRERVARARAGIPEDFGLADLYPDVAPCLQRLRTAGYLIGIAGNQPARTEELLQELGLPADVIASSQRWGVEKPSAEFFARVVEAAGVPPEQIAYVGDRVDNDVLPALSAGMIAVFLRRGPWGYLHALRPEVQRAHIRVDSLADLPIALRDYSAHA
jgi:FMN phosphatase YigB (HAD superfamily)